MDLIWIIFISHIITDKYLLILCLILYIFIFLGGQFYFFYIFFTEKKFNQIKNIQETWITFYNENFLENDQNDSHNHTQTHTQSLIGPIHNRRDIPDQIHEKPLLPKFSTIYLLKLIFC